jgi:hypothetical protein
MKFCKLETASCACSVIIVRVLDLVTMDL